MLILSSYALLLFLIIVVLILGKEEQQQAFMNTTTTNNNVTLESCQEFKQLRFLSRLETHFQHNVEGLKVKRGIFKYNPPPLLLSFPGSGNTWSRLLIEYATGVYSGSMEVNDIEYKNSFVGEVYCSVNTSIIKAHPQDLYFNQQEPLITFKSRIQLRKCRRGFINNFKRVVFVTRNPLDAIWSNFQLQLTKSHTGNVIAISFNRNSWTNFAIQSAQDWFDKWNELILPMKSSAGEADFRELRYESLLLPTPHREEELRKALAFMGYRPSNRQLKCAFLLAEKPFAHRKVTRASSMTAYDAYYGIGKANNNISRDAFISTLDKSLTTFADAYNYSLVVKKKKKGAEGVALNVSFDQCINQQTSSHNLLSFIPEEYMHTRARAPPLLLSFFGSSDSWVRRLVEYSTGYYTGSLKVEENSYDQAFQGDAFCGIRLVVSFFSLIYCSKPRLKYQCLTNPLLTIIILLLHR